MQFFCECDDFDQLADDWVTSCCNTCCSCCTCCETEEERRRPPKTPVDRADALRKVFATIEDRSRVPWFGGAKKVNAGAVAAPLVLRVIQLALILSDRLSWNLFWLGVVGVKLVWLHLTCLRIQWRTDYFASWIVFSIVGLYSQYLSVVFPRQRWLGVFVMHAILIVTLVAFGLAVWQRPSLQGGRSYACRVCGNHIHRRDHHCVWINQCVGSHNHRAFVCFTTGFATLGLSYSCLASMALASAATQDSVLGYMVDALSNGVVSSEATGALYAAVGGLFAAALTMNQVSNIGRGLTTHECKHLARSGRWNRSEGHPLGRCRDWQRHPFDSGGFVQNWKAWLSGECLGDFQNKDHRDQEGAHM